MTEQEILSKAAQAFVDTETYIDVPVEPKNFLERFLIKHKLKKSYVRYPVRKILVGNRFRLASRVILMPKDIFKHKDLVSAIMDASVIINEDLIYICAVAIQNDRNEPSKALMDNLRWVNDETFARILDKSLNLIDVQSFMKSIALIQGSKSLLQEEKASPADTRETIARGDKSTVTDDTSK